MKFTEAVIVAIISNATTILVVVLSRLWSHLEHRQTEQTVTDTNEKVTGLVNGKIL